MTIQEKITAILLRLPIREDRRFSVEARARAFAVCCDHFFARLDLPGENDAGTDAAQRSLEKFARLAADLQAQINAMPREAVIALRAEIDMANTAAYALLHPTVRDDPVAWLGFLRPPDVLRNGLSGYARCAEGAQARLADCRTPNRKGAPQKRRANAITRVAAENFEWLTGEPVKHPSVGEGRKASGLFLNFLAELFEALEIKASPESQARAYLMEKSPPNEAL